MNIQTVSNQWASRPSDERHTSLESLREAVANRRSISNEKTLPVHSLSVAYDEQNNVFLSGHNGASVQFTNWSFAQLSQMVGAPPSYLRKLPAPLAALNLGYGIEDHRSSREDAKLLYTYARDERQGQALAFTSPTYGRIWDQQVVEAVMNMNEDGRWSVPTPFRTAADSAMPSSFVVDKQSTTLYASDRDVFMFLVDENRPIEIDGQMYFRGFYTWNSEVGKATFGLTAFLYSYVCANRIIWGATEIQELRIRHTSLAPDRFMQKARPALEAMSEASPGPIIEAIKTAKLTRVGNTVKDVESWLKGKGFDIESRKVGLRLAETGGDSGSDADPTTLWGVVQGLTAFARTINHQDDRTDFERKVGALMTPAGTVAR